MRRNIAVSFVWGWAVKLQILKLNGCGVQDRLLSYGIQGKLVAK